MIRRFLSIALSFSLAASSLPANASCELVHATRPSLPKTFQMEALANRSLLPHPLRQGMHPQVQVATLLAATILIPHVVSAAESTQRASSTSLPTILFRGVLWVGAAGLLWLIRHVASKHQTTISITPEDANLLRRDALIHSLSSKNSIIRREAYQDLGKYQHFPEDIYQGVYDRFQTARKADGLDFKSEYNSETLLFLIRAELDGQLHPAPGVFESAFQDLKEKHDPLIRVLDDYRFALLYVVMGHVRDKIFQSRVERILLDDELSALLFAFLGIHFRSLAADDPTDTPFVLKLYESFKHRFDLLHEERELTPDEKATLAYNGTLLFQGVMTSATGKMKTSFRDEIAPATRLLADALPEIFPDIVPEVYTVGRQEIAVGDVLINTLAERGVEHNGTVITVKRFLQGELPKLYSDPVFKKPTPDKNFQPVYDRFTGRDTNSKRARAAA